ncbi:MAG: type II restriction endonuclease [Sphaerochaetaceae bacterium]
MESSTIALKAIQAASNGKIAYCKFLSANDTGETNSHQSGIYIAKPAVPVIFNVPGIKGSNMDRYVEIVWQDAFKTQSRFIYYGQASRNEYRITQFGIGFPFLSPEHTGDLFVLVKQEEEHYDAYVLSTEDEIEEFLSAFGMSPADTGTIIQKDQIGSEARVDFSIDDFIKILEVDFPPSAIMSAAARDIYHKLYNHTEDIIKNPDKVIIDWTEMEYRVFRRLELWRYGELIKTGFSDVETFISVANMVLNRRKSRAGKSLENHLAAIFSGNNINFESQVITEGNKRPDFIFPGGKEYRDPHFPSEKLVFLGAKTTCKDRWRQIINEADRVKTKYLFTLQQGISTSQLEEMESEGVSLVVPAKYLPAFPEISRSRILTLNGFITIIKNIYS